MSKIKREYIVTHLGGPLVCAVLTKKGGRIERHSAPLYYTYPIQHTPCTHFDV